MKIIRDLDITLKKPTAIAVGFFDGVHRGHKAVIIATTILKEKGLESCVFSFEMIKNSPVAKKGAKLITTQSLKIKEIEALDADIFLTPPFSAFMGMSPEEFAVELLYKKLNAKVVCCGEDYRFGKGSSAGVKELRELLAPYGVEVLSIDAVTDTEIPISSSRIREALKVGDIRAANRLLGHPFAFDFPVSHGKQLGGRLGFPTANQIMEESFCTPRFGVYASVVEINGQRYQAVTNIGVAPTVGSDKVYAESFILDFHDDVYGLPMKTTLIEFLRDEKKFDSIDDLKVAISKDAITAKNLRT